MADIPEWALAEAAFVASPELGVGLRRNIARALAATAARVELETRDIITETAMRFRQESWKMEFNDDAEYGYETACKSIEDTITALPLKNQEVGL